MAIQNTAQLFDALIIGAGPAGLAMASALARQKHTALVFDSGIYRNAKGKHMHNVLGFDHVNPADFRKKAKDDLLNRYPHIKFQNATITTVKRLDSGKFEATDSTGTVYTGRKIGLATGVRDIMSDIPGYKDCWARGM